MSTTNSLPRMLQILCCSLTALKATKIMMTELIIIVATTSQVAHTAHQQEFCHYTLQKDFCHMTSYFQTMQLSAMQDESPSKVGLMFAQSHGMTKSN
jgi:hypothetical protein